MGFASRLFAVIRFESIIHEFDPWFNYRSTAYMVQVRSLDYLNQLRRFTKYLDYMFQHGFYDFLNWFDERAWYPLGRIVGGTVYPGQEISHRLVLSL